MRYLVARNAGAATRTGHVSVEGTLFTVQQEACRFTLDPTSASLDARSSVRTVQVRTSDVCQWTARSNASWIVVTSGFLVLTDREVIRRERIKPARLTARGCEHILAWPRR